MAESELIAETRLRADTLETELVGTQVTAILAVFFLLIGLGEPLAARLRLPFNVIPHIDKFLDDQYTKEERKVTWETRKIMDLPDLPVSCTCVRIPTLRAHGEAITIETNPNRNPNPKP